MERTRESLPLDWRRNLRGGEQRLRGERDASWWTGMRPHGAHRPLPAADMRAGVRGLRAHFEYAWTLTEVLFAGLQGEEAFYRPPAHGLRHPLVFYYGHAAAFWANKLRAAALLREPVDAELEEMFSTGVDEQSWDDLSKNDGAWPRVEDITIFRRDVRQRVLDIIDGAPQRAITWDDELWALPMALEHELIHAETSSVLVRELPIELVRRPRAWPVPHPTVLHAGPRRDIPLAWIDVPASDVVLGRPATDATYGWDNEHGSLAVHVPAFAATDRLVSNADFAEFVEAGGYAAMRFWSEAGWNWRRFRDVEHPSFWVTDRRQTLTTARLRLVFEEVAMPWDAPAIVNWHEANAYAAWRSMHDLAKSPYRLLTEAEHARLLANPGAHGANLALAWGSESPVDALPPDALGFHDIRGNVWQWCMDAFAPLPGFRPHPFYPDYSTPSFDGAHHRIVGGSFMTAGAGAGPHARNHFRPHFHQHAGFRLVRPAV